MTIGYTPTYRILKGTEDITGHFNDRTTSIQCDITSGGGSNDTFKIVLDDRDFLIALPSKGAQLSIELGYKEIGLSEQGIFQIDEIYLEGPPRSMRLNGNSAGMRGVMKAPTLKEFDNKTLGDIINDLAKRGGVQAQIDGDLASKKLPFLNQFGSNYHLLNELERRYGAVAKFEFGKLIFSKRDSGDSTSGISLPMPIIRPEHIATWSVMITDRSSFTSVKAAWWDKENNKRVWEEHKSDKLAAENDSSGENLNPFVFGKLFNSQDEAKSAAEARSAALARANGQITIELAKGNPWIRAQQPMIVVGMRDGINGSYIIEAVSHTYVKSRGIATKIVAKPSGTGEDFSDEANENNTFPLAGETLGILTPFSHRQAGPV